MSVSRDPVTGNIQVTCNTCGALAPPATELLKNHGLINMGWECHGGTHLCPQCKETDQCQT